MYYDCYFRSGVEKRTMMSMLKDGKISSIWVSESGEFCKIIMPGGSLNRLPLSYKDENEAIYISASDKKKDHCKKDKCKDDKDSCKKKDPCKKDKCKDYDEKSKCN